MNIIISSTSTSLYMTMMTIIRKFMLYIAIFSAFAVVQTKAQADEPDITVDCDPCIDRSKYKIRAIVHGREKDPFWQEIRQAMVETANNMGIDFQMTLYKDDIASVEIPRAMTTDIRNAVVLENPHALIVSVPGDSLVERALESIQDRVPIFVVNALTPFPLPSEAGSTKMAHTLPTFQAATYMDENDAATLIANQIQRRMRDLDLVEYEDDEKPLGVYINHEPGIPFLTHRYNVLSDATNNDIEWERFDFKSSSAEIEVELTSLFEGCNYTVVQLAGEIAAEATINALTENGCDQDSMIVGTFGANTLIHDAIDAGTVDFAIAQQPSFQGTVSVLLASIYATTGQTLAAREGETNLIESGPTLITSDNIPTNNEGSSRSDQTTLSIKVLTHDLVTDPFWETVYSGLQQAASDFGVNLATHRFKSAVTGRGEVSLERSFSVREACRSADIDGLIVSLPHDAMLDALSVCDSRNIPVVVINAAPEESMTQGFSYVGQQDYQSGFEAGKILIDNGVRSGYCLVHADLSSLKERCRGVEDAFAEQKGAEYKGIIKVFTQDENEYKTSVELALGNGNWTDIGVVSTGQIQVSALLSLLQEHPELKAGTFDLDISSNEPDNQLLFSIDQQPYLQGYLASALMKWKVSDRGILTNPSFPTGPKLPFKSPSKQRKRCQEYGYHVCKPKPPLKFSGKCADLGRTCAVCEGDCNNDSDCGEGLVCFVRDSKTLGAYQDVPGCSGNPIEFNAKDFCVDSAMYTCKDEEPFRLRARDGQGFETCDFVAQDLSRCTMYGIFCRETCGYCRSQPQQ